MKAHDRRIAHSSQNMDWGTPRDLFAALDAKYHFTLDAAATGRNKLCPAYLSPRQDALTQPWPGRVWVNPPYGRGVGTWVEHAANQAVCGTAELVVMLLASRTDSRWWHNTILRYASKIYFIKGRLTFHGAPDAAPFPSIVVVFARNGRPFRSVPEFRSLQRSSAGYVSRRLDDEQGF